MSCDRVIITVRSSIMTTSAIAKTWHMAMNLVYSSHLLVAIAQELQYTAILQESEHMQDQLSRLNLS